MYVCILLYDLKANIVRVLSQRSVVLSGIDRTKKLLDAQTSF